MHRLTLTSRFVVFFLLPTVILGLLFIILMQRADNVSVNWIVGIVGSLVIIGISATVMTWGEIGTARDELSSLHGNLSSLRGELTGKAWVCGDYNTVMSEAERIVADPELKQADVYVYKGYPTNTTEREERYFGATIDAIERERICKYYRIMTIRNDDELACVISVMKLISQSERARCQIRLYVSYRAPANYISFLVAGDHNCLVALPNLSAGPESIRDHLCCVVAKDCYMVQGLKEIFGEIRRQECEREKIEIPPADGTDWDEVYRKLRAPP